MKAELFSVGTELLLGHITDTNAPYLAQQLSILGIDLYYISQVGDNLGRLTESLRRARQRSDLIVITGGLGPTEDDLTREAISALLDEQMVVQPELERDLRQFFASRGYEMPERNVKQATLIASARAIPNPIGTAPGWYVERDGRIIVAMPGVPVEMKRMWENEVAPRLRERQGSGIIFSRALKIIGMGESAVEEKVAALTSSTNPTIATYAKQDGIHLRVTAKAPEEQTAERLVAEMEAKVRAIVGTFIYGVDDETLQDSIGSLFVAQGLSIAVMESVTGGLLASTITDAAGSSAYFKGGVVAYTRETKIANGVDPTLIEAHGTVSREVAQAMATAIRQRLSADVGMATTGVAGPAEIEGKPAGTVHIAIDNRGRCYAQTASIASVRAEVKRRAVISALNLVRRSLLGAL